MSASPMPATTASSRLRSWASSSAAWRSSSASDSIDVAMESNVSLSTPISSSLRTAARTVRSPLWIPSAAAVRRRSPDPMRSPTASATTRASSDAPRATRKRVRNSELRVLSTRVVGSAATMAKVGVSASGPLGWAAMKNPPALVDTDTLSRSDRSTRLCTAPAGGARPSLDARMPSRLTTSRLSCGSVMRRTFK